MSPQQLALGINVEKPKFPQYAVYSKRLESFDAWPEHIPVKKEDLVEAGLVYTGIGDSVRCYFCGGGLRNWERDDVPMEEHAKLYPKCPHIMLVKGQGYVERLIRGENQDEVDGLHVQLPHQESATPDYLESIPAQSCLQMGFSREMVKTAIDIYVDRNGNSEFKARDLAEIIFHLEGQAGGLQSVDTNNGTVSDQYSGANGDRDQHNEDRTEFGDLNTIEPIEILLEENRRLKERTHCKMCYESPSSTVFVPCGHLVTCTSCATDITECPICRKVVATKIQINSSH